MKDRKFNKAVRIVFIFFIFLLSLPYLTTLSIDVIDIDSAQYAEIVREMVETGVYDNIQDNGRKYLDKPILTFWTILPFFEFFGANNFSYRLPAILITLLSCLSLYYTVLITSENKRRALFAVWIYLLLPGLYAMVVDPKIDVYLTAYLIFSHMFYYMGRIKNTNWFFAMYFSIGLGFITKGPISLVIPFISIGLDILFRRDWKLLTKMKIPQGVFLFHCYFLEFGLIFSTKSFLLMDHRFFYGFNLLEDSIKIFTMLDMILCIFTKILRGPFCHFFFLLLFSHFISVIDIGRVFPLKNSLEKLKMGITTIKILFLDFGYICSYF
jgi:4-amino-4-deoxy-L-arabinose transferase-like glycosyltransferase